MKILGYRVKPVLTAMMLLASTLVSGQGFLHADGKRIVNGENENVILRGIGTGNWMIQEGYMMRTAGVAGTQHEFRAKLIESIGEVKTDSFYTVWLENHFTRTDVDSMASWGFNCVRVAMHYKWFTLPIEDEPVEGEQSWLDRGFVMMDSLLQWCGDNKMYLILDMHGAPGGQGKNADISDYDPTKPSLWESADNKDKFVALWQRLAARYSDEPWMGGYDLINETNWPFPEGNNSQMSLLYKRTTDSIRSVDPNHMIIIEGNSYANDFSGLTPPWDPNMAYSFHKYWTFNNSGSLSWVTEMRDRHNVPIWNGETGENSNTWFTNVITLHEEQNIGWSMWPVKKTGINNVLSAATNEDYLQLVENWKGNGPMLSEEEAFQAVLTFARNHNIKNCSFQRDVVDAMIRQPHTTETLPFVKRSIMDPIFASEYDLGRNNYAYFDKDTADYHGEGQGFIAWNQGWAFRSDGVDVEACSDTPLSNAYSVGWTSTDEWMAYTLESDSLASYSMEFRSASGSSGSKIRVEVNGVDATGTVSLPGTGGWYSWTSTEIENVIVPKGEVELKIVFESGGSNLNYFRLKDPQAVSELPFEYLSAQTAVLENVVYITLNKEIGSTELIPVSEFELVQGGEQVLIDSMVVSEDDGRVMAMYTSEPLFYGKVIEVSYSGASILHEEQVLGVFESKRVSNQMARHFSVPTRIQAEYFYENNGLVLESCTDIGGGKNTGYANKGDYLDYILFVEEEGDFDMNFRIASEQSGAGLSVQADYGDGMQSLKNVTFARTGGWQTWTTQTAPVHLEAGKFILRLLVTGSEHNLNWFEFEKTVGTFQPEAMESFMLYPNPASSLTTLQADAALLPAQVLIQDIAGRLVYARKMIDPALRIETESFPAGVYFVQLAHEGLFYSRKLIIH